MKRSLFLFLIILIAACNNDAADNTTDENSESVVKNDTVYVDQDPDTVFIKEDEKSDPVKREWTAAKVQQEHTLNGNAVVKDIRLASHQDYERVVVELEQHMPSYVVEYVDEPYHQCGSGKQMWLEGDGLLEIHLTTAVAHTEQGEPTVKRNYKSLENIKELKVACDYEGHVNILAGVGSPNKFAVFELQNPPRLVIDIKKGQ